MNLTTATPVEIDTVLYDLHVKRVQAQTQAERYWSSIERLAHSYLGKNYRETVTAQEVRDVLVEVVEEGAKGYYINDKIRDTFARYEDAISQADQYLLDMQPYDEEYERRGRWNRAYLVINANGHVHRSMGCSTCFDSTRYHWVVEFSGKDEAEIVEAAGERACTVCYPSAPVEVLSRPTQMFTPDEVEKQKAREEREAKKAKAAAAQVTVEGYTGWRGQRETKTFKTVRAVTNDIASNLTSLCWYGVEHPSANEWLSNIDVCRKALVDHSPEGEAYDFDKALTNARKKVKREGGTPRF